MTCPVTITISNGTSNVPLSYSCTLTTGHTGPHNNGTGLTWLLRTLQLIT